MAFQSSQEHPLMSLLKHLCQSKVKAVGRMSGSVTGQHHSMAGRESVFSFRKGMYKQRRYAFAYHSAVLSAGHQWKAYRQVPEAQTILHLPTFPQERYQPMKLFSGKNLQRLDYRLINSAVVQIGQSPQRTLKDDPFS